MDPFIALSYNGLDPLKVNTFGSPVARAASAILASAEDHQRSSLISVAHSRIIETRDFSAREVDRNTAFSVRKQPILESDVRKRAAHHDLVIAATRSIGVKVPSLHAPLQQILSGRTFRGNAPRR